MTANRPAQILQMAADIKAQAQKIDTSKTETVTVADLKVGDIILHLGKVEFPFPFTLSQVRKIGTFGTTLAATHGWFTPGPVNGKDKVVRVVR